MNYIQKYDFSDHEDSEPLAVKIRTSKKHKIRNIIFIISGVMLFLAVSLVIYSKFIFDPASNASHSNFLIDIVMWIRNLL